VTDDIVTRLRESDGEGCTCGAWNYSECGCLEAVWAEMFITEAADEIERLRKERDEWHELAENLYTHLSTYVCHCNMAKCKCGYDDVLGLYDETKQGKV
jgi:hypothetical protein